MSDWIDAMDSLHTGKEFNFSALSDLDRKCALEAMSAEIAAKVIQIASGEDGDLTKKLKAGQLDIYQRAINIYGRVGEAKTCAIFDYLINQGESAILKQFDDAVSVRREVKFECGFADRVVEHADRSITVVEIKPAGSRRDHMQGLGQALMYACAAREISMSNEVRAALFVSGDSDKWVEAACKSAGAMYICVPKTIEMQLDRYARYAQRVVYGS